MKNYSEMSDQEINMAVAEVLFPDRDVIESKSRPPCACVIGQFPNKWVDYCNNPADAWQTIYDNKITLIACLDGWISCPYGSVIDGDTTESQSVMYVNSWNKATCFADKNPLRAAMIVFLMMQEK